jgi:hypothetical protein
MRLLRGKVNRKTRLFANTLGILGVFFGFCLYLTNFAGFRDSPAEESI